MPDFRTFRVLLNEPADPLALGDWGSGKTTFMEAIRRELPAERRGHPGVVQRLDIRA